MKYLIIFSLLVFVVFVPHTFAADTAVKIIPVLSPKSIKLIGERVWYNECLKRVDWLISWNEGEKFASLGIGHNIWYTANQRDVYDEGFPKLIQYLRSKHVTMPKWLDQPNTPPCLWQSREEFLQAVRDNDPRLQELRKFLVNTIPQQAKYLIYRLETVIPQILDLIPANEKLSIQREITSLMQNPTGVYALVDYVNFKGDGIKEYKSCLLTNDQNSYRCGWGLLQVLREMLAAPKYLTPNGAYVWAVSKVLKHRVASAPLERKAREAKWLPGWLTRISTYKVHS